MIRRLTIERFRGIESLVWLPTPGVNIILGGGDVGKTTILDAIALLLHPTNTAVVSDADYWRREVDRGFSVEAVMSLPDSCGINQHAKNAWPWLWDGEKPTLPIVDDEQVARPDALPVYRFRVQGTSDFDLVFEVIQPDDTTDHFSVVARRKIGLVRLTGDDRNDRDLRLVHGSALDKLISDKTLRSRITQQFDESDIEKELKKEAKENLEALEKAFAKQGLPTGLGLGLTGGLGFSLNALIGLTATKDGVHLPLSSWGAGSRRLAALETAAAHHGDNPITVVDEIERGLEPYRQRALMAGLERGTSQVFLTTHSAAALSAAPCATLWYLNSDGRLGEIKSSVRWLRERDPEAFLARLAIIAEGKTEMGFLDRLLQKALHVDRLDLGIWLTDAMGNDNTLTLLEELSGSGLEFAGFADDEGRSPARWAKVQQQLGPLLFRWPAGCLEQNIIALVPDDRFEEFIKNPEGQSGERLRTLADRLNIDDKSYTNIRAHSSDMRRLLIEATTGMVPEQVNHIGDSKALRKHPQVWFKSIEGGRELGNKVFQFGIWPQLKAQLLPFLNAVRTAIALPTIDELLS